METQDRIPAALIARVVQELPPNRGRGECRVRAAPAASRANGEVKHTSVVTEGSPGSPGIPARNGFNGLFRALPGERIRLVTVISGLRFCQTRSGRLSLRKFNTSNGCQDHTALPYASRHLSSARRFIAHEVHLALRFPYVPDAAASTASRPASATIAIRPSSGTRRRGI